MNIAQIEQNIDKLISDFTSSNVNQTDFIYELLLAYGHRKQSVTRLRSGERNLSEKDNEVIWRRHLYFRTVDSNALDAEINQIRSEKVIERYKLRFIIVTNFNQLLAVDTKTTDTLDIELSELPKHFDFFLPWAGMEKAVYQGENPADVKAAEKMAKLFDLIKEDNFDESNKDDKDALHNLNVFLTRLLFCFFAEDTEIFTTNQFSNVIKSHTNEDGSDLSDYLNRLFNVLNTAEDNRKDLPDYLATFPYVNGGLFADDIQSPTFSAKSRRMLIECGSELDWSDINPDIFGSMIQAVVHPDQRGGMGMHYTSVTNIMKVIEPLFLNDLYDEFEKHEHKPKKLQELLQRLGSIKIFDPACGSGNFLIIAYKELRNLEMDILKQLQDIEFNKSGQKLQPFSEIKLSQFYGIEIDDFAHEVAILSLWLSEHQMNVEFKAEFGESSASLPLKASGSIVCDNATRIEWNDVCPHGSGEVYVIGNPPYLGSKNQDESQKEDMRKCFDGISQTKSLDYICCWFIKAAKYINAKSQFSFVSTNSICQGTQVPLLWPTLLNMGMEISFAYKKFVWSNNAKNKAGVTCSIVGIRRESDSPKYLFHDVHKREVKNISPYLIESNNTIVLKSSMPISGLSRMQVGNEPYDGGFLIFTSEEKEQFVAQDERSLPFFKKLVGSSELLKGTYRWCLWIDNEDLAQAKEIEIIKNRIDKVRVSRENGGMNARSCMDRPHQFRWTNRADKSQLIIPLVSSERRHYIPIGLSDRETILTNLVQAVYDPEPHMFGILNSKIHMAWVRLITGRMRTDYRYTAGLCWNSFPFPDISNKERELIFQSSLGIIQARENHSESNLATLYDPEKMPKDLLIAHTELDEVVDSLYKKSGFRDDEERLECLFDLYAGMIGDQSA